MLMSNEVTFKKFNKVIKNQNIFFFSLKFAVTPNLANADSGWLMKM